MRSTMMDYPLTVTRLMTYGTGSYGTSQVSTLADDGVRTRSYAEVGARAARLASALRGLGVTADQRVATFQWNNTEHLEAYLAIPAMGAVLHTLNIRLFPGQLTYIVGHADDRVLIADGTLVPLLARVLPSFSTVRDVLVTGGPGVDTSALEGIGPRIHDYEELLAGQPDSFPWPADLDERSAAAMCYTSGTTGEPKGVVYSHRSMFLHSMAVCMGDALGLTPTDRCLPIVPMFHANAWGLPYAAMLVGADLVMPDRFMQADRLIDEIAAQRVTVSAAVPTIWIDILEKARSRSSDLSSLRLVVCGGSAVPASLMRHLEEEFGVHMVQAWGMTETSPLASIAHPPARATGEGAWRYRAGQGRLLAEVEGRLADPAGGPLPHDGETVGEIEVRGPWVTARYHRDEELTEQQRTEKFHDGWLRTGDVGMIDEAGYITLTDRAKDIIKSGGEWISSVDLENTLMGHPDVVEAAVVGVPDHRWQERPLAAVVLRPGASAGPEELRGYLSERIAKWQLPERWAVIDEVPKTSVGKFSKLTLRTMYADGKLEVTTLA